MQSQALVQTELGSSYIKRLCTHFAHKIEVEYSDYEGVAHFAMGTCTMYADSTSLRFVAEAAEQAALEKVQYIVTDHLERFAFRENLKLAWHAVELV